MKFKSLTILICVFFSYTLSAQIPMGTKYLGGTVGFSSTKAKTDGADAFTEWSLAPEFGYFFKDNMALGLGIGLTGAKAGDTELNGFGGMVYVRKFWNASDNFHVYAGLNVEYGSTKLTFGGNDSSLNNFGAALDLGIWYNVSDKWTVAGRLGTLGFASSSNPDDDTDGETAFGLNVSTVTTPFNLGLYYSF
ncbi:MAG: outer membrane beta-barrel protein [Saprospiraceae bacterium]